MADTPQSVFYGGQAIIEGVMVRTARVACAAMRAPDGAIVRREISQPKWAALRLRNVPFLRGVVIIVESLVVGFRALNISAEVASQEQAGDADAEQSGSNSWADRVATVGILVVTLAVVLLLFLGVPNLPFIWFDGLRQLWIVENVIEGLLRFAILILYIWGIGVLFRDIKRMYGYHGAEHKTIAAREAGRPLTPSVIREYPKEHPRCGTAFLFTVGIVTLVVFSFLPREPLWLLVLSRIVGVPVMMAVSYEIIRFGSQARGAFFGKIVNAPNLFAQKLTTREPDDEMIEVAVAAMNYAVELEQSADNISVSPSGAEASATDL